MEDENPFGKAQTVDPEVRAYVYSLVNALGGSSADDTGRYVLGDDALACLRDLKRWLKLYDEKTNRLDVARCLAEANLVLGDLLPILASWYEDDLHDKLKARVALACLELLVPLTWPLETGGEMTVNHHRHTPFLQQAQVTYKAGILGFAGCSVLRQVVRIGLPAIALSREARTNRDEGIMKLLLYFLRNITVIRQIPNLPSQGLDNEVSRSATVESFRQQDVLALLLTMCSNMGEDFNSQDVILLEILFNLIKGVDADKLWMTEDQRKGQELSDLQQALTIEKGWERDHKKNGALGWSRHGRFGTMLWIKRDEAKMSAVSGQDNLKDGRHALFNMDRTKKWNKPQQRRKDIEHTIYDFDRTTYLTSSATELLRNFVEEFLDSGFNPLLTHLRKAIEREAERLLDINYRQFFYTVAWFLQAERARRQKAAQERKDKPQKLAADFEAESYALVAAVLNQETFITLNRYMQASYDNKEWQDLNASMRCFTQILLTVQEMAQSSLEEDQDIAENIQNRIFYEETTHDRIITILKGYKDQGFGYLDACTELSQVFLRMLERYSKENVDLQIRSRRRARRKKKEETRATRPSTDDNHEPDDEQSENEDIADVVQVSRERKFDFTRFAAKFTSQSSVNTFVALTTFYRDLTPDQLKRAHRFFYRVAFKQEMAVLLYRVDIIALFYKMIKGPEGVDENHPLFKEWSEFVKQLLKKMFKKIDARPELVIEMLFSKVNATLYYLEYGQEKQTLKDTRPAAEVQIKGEWDVKAKIGIVVAALLRDEKERLVKWVIEILANTSDQRKGWEDEHQARRALVQEPGAEEAHRDAVEVRELPEPTVIRAPDEATRTAAFRNARLRLLMKLVGLELLEEDLIGAAWSLPSSHSSVQLQESKSTIEACLHNPWKAGDSEEAPESYIKRVSNFTSRDAVDEEDDARRDAFIDDSEGASGDEPLEELQFPGNGRSKNKVKSIAEQIRAKRTKRKREEDDQVDEATLEERRRKREKAALETRQKIKSKKYIGDSDDETDEDYDKEFFRREEEGRKRQIERIRTQMHLTAHENGKVGKVVGNPHSVETVQMLNDEMDTATASSQPQRQTESEGEEGSEEETPMSSQSSGTLRRVKGPSRVLRELTQPRVKVSNAVSKAAEVDAGVGPDLTDDDDDLVITSSALPARRRTRAGFVFDSDDEE